MIVGPGVFRGLDWNGFDIMAACAHRIFFLILTNAMLHFVAAAPSTAFDFNRVHGFYRNGDFDKVIHDLEGFVKSRRKCTQAESIFVEKHLAVVYAANPATRELGRYHMHRLLDLAPNSELIDMFVGEEVDGVFEKVRKEFDLGKTSSLRITSSPIKYTPSRLYQKPIPSVVPHSDPVPQLPLEPLPSETVVESDTSTEPPWKNTGVLIGSGAALALMALTLYYSDPPKSNPSKTYVVPATLSH